jgi:hypothetical protein
MLNILSGKEDENLKDNTDQMNGEDPETYVDEVKEAIYKSIKGKVNEEPTEETPDEDSDNQGIM